MSTPITKDSAARNLASQKVLDSVTATLVRAGHTQAEALVLATEGMLTSGQHRPVATPLPEYELRFQEAVTDLVMRHIDRMNDVCEEDLAVHILKSFTTQMDPIFDAYMDDKFPGRAAMRNKGGRHRSG